MIRVAWKGLAARPVRTALTTLAIVIGVAFVCAAYTLTDTMSGAARQRSPTPPTTARTPSSSPRPRSAARRPSDVRAQAPTIPASTLAAACAPRAGVDVAVGDITDTAQIIGRDGKPVGSGPYFGVGFDAAHAGRGAADAVPPARRRAGRPGPARS